MTTAPAFSPRSQAAAPLEVALESIERGAAGLYDRIDRRYVPSSAPAAEARALLRRWEAGPFRGEAGLFETRLALDGLTRSEALRLLSPIRRAPGTPSPAWLSTLREVLGQAPSPTATTRGVPFDQVLAPFVQVAVSRLAPLPPTGLVAPEVFHTFVKALVRRLSDVAGESIYRSFDTFRCSGPAGSPGATGRYEAFIERMRTGGLQRLLTAYPVLARLLSLTVDQWVQFADEFFSRATSDASALAGLVGISDRLRGPLVIRVDFTMSDAHNDGRSVIVVHLATGKRVLYKPRGLAVDAATARFAARLRDAGAPTSLRVPRVIERAEYGWASFAEATPCPNLDAYYREAGGLLGLVYLLGGSDFHSENVIATADGPVVIDFEMILKPSLDADRSKGALDPLQRTLDQSVLSTDLLPVVDLSSSQAAIDLSGFSGWGGNLTDVARRSWVAVNTDQMELREAAESVLPTHSNLPLGPDGRTLPHAFREQVREGFASVYQFALDIRPALIAEGGLLDEFRESEVRFLLRGTELYHRMLARVNRPSHFRNGLTRDFEFERLAPPVLRGSHPDQLWPLFRTETMELGRLDVPKFVVSATALTVTESREALFAESALQRARARVERIGPEDLKLQEELILGALNTPYAGTDPAPHVSATSPEELARFLIDTLTNRAIPTVGGGASWVSPARPDGTSLRILDESLHGGVSGVALLAAALFRLRGRPADADLARRSLVSIQRRLEGDGWSPAAWPEIGGIDGLGSMAYALAQTASLLDDPSLLDDAVRAARWITPDRIRGASSLDFVSGVAGALASLLHVHRATQEASLLTTARACGDRLAASVTQLDTLGLSHGTAGALLALARLSAATGGAYSDAVAIALDQLVRAYDPHVRNWPRAAGEGTEGAMHAWCHGSVGVTLALQETQSLGTVPAGQREAVDNIIRDVLEHQMEAPVCVDDHACCGTMGRIELLLCSGTPRAIEAARALSATVTQTAHQQGGYHVGGQRSWLAPGFFLGTVGVSYQLLRTEAPDTIPSVLTLA